jgi:hypothetical protein
VQRDELAHQRQPDAGTLVGAALGVLDPVEALEQAWQLRLGDPYARVRHDHLRPGASGRWAHRHCHLPLQSELEGVGDEVQHDPLPEVAVDIDGVAELMPLDHEAQSRSFEQRPESGRDLGGAVGKVNRGEARLDTPRFDARKVEQRIHQL